MSSYVARIVDARPELGDQRLLSLVCPVHVQLSVSALVKEYAVVGESIEGLMVWKGELISIR